MFRRFLKRLLALLTLIPSLALAGGTIPVGHGATYSGHSYIPNVPPSINTLFLYRYYGAGRTPEIEDDIDYGISTIDYEFVRFQFRYSSDNPNGNLFISFSIVDEPVWSQCGDGIPGGCTLAQTSCMLWTNSPTHRLCSDYRIRIWPNNIANGGPIRQRLPGIIRHELGHVLGLDHWAPGPMTNNNNAPFGSCQTLMLRTFWLDSSNPAWFYPTIPECVGVIP